MKRKDMPRLLPFEADYTLLAKCRKWGSIVLGVICISSVALPILNIFIHYKPISVIWNILNMFYFLMIIAYYVLDIYTETFLYPATARKRRKGFIDNSLGSKFLEKKVEGYYTNDSVKIGPYKMIVNCCENCYFTMNIAKAMVPQVVLKNVVFGVAFLIVAYFGIKDNLVAIPILQILLSTLFLTELVHHINFLTKLDHLFERFKHTLENKPNDSQVLQEAVLLYLDYETTLAYNKAPLSDKIYEKLNEKLSKEWEDIKIRYDISQ